MTKEHTKELFGIITQILPFLMVTVVFIGFAYTSGRTHLLCQEDISTMMKLSCNCLP
jgi:uncharacterized membrane protein YkvI